MSSDVLDLINLAREALGFQGLTEMPLGIPGDCWECPIARGLEVLDQQGISVTSDLQIRTSAARKIAAAWGTRWRRSLFDRTGLPVRMMGKVELPPVLLAFVANFDARKIPDLIDLGLDDLEREIEQVLDQLPELVGV